VGKFCLFKTVRKLWIIVDNQNRYLWVMQKSRLTLSLNFLWVLLACLPFVHVNSLSDPTLLSRQFPILLIAAGLWLFCYLQQEFSPVKFPLPLLLFVTTLFFGYQLSSFWALNLPEANYSASKMSTFIVLLVLFYQIFQQKMFQRQWLYAAISIASFIGLILLGIELQALLKKGINLWQQKNLYELNSAFGHKNLYSSFQLLCLPFIVLLWFKTKMLVRIALSVLILLVLVSLVLIQTKAVLLGLFFAASLLLLLAVVTKQFSSKTFRISVLLTYILITLGSIVLVYSFPQKFTLLLNNDTIRERILLWTNTLHMIKEHPWLGVGAGNWQIWFPKYGLSGFLETNYLVSDGFTTFQRPHNDFLWVLSEVGLIGFLAYAGLFLYALYACYQGIKAKQKKAWVIVGALLAYIVTAASDFPLERNEHQLLLAILLAFAYSFKPKPQQLYRLSLWFLLIPILLITYNIFQRFPEEQKVKKVIEAYQLGDNEKMLKWSQEIETQFISIDNFSIPIAWYKGLALHNTGNTPAAQEANLEAYETNPYQIHVINNLAGMYALQNNFIKAEQLYKEALTISPTQPDALLNLCSVLYNQQKIDEAFRTLYKFKFDEGNIQYLNCIYVIGKAYWEQKGQKEIVKEKLVNWFKESKLGNSTFELAIKKTP
jgi:O-antigen ligase